ncbi:hypothetical protein MAPG_02148 [Magnaporthiopsis poae ATCC 64411]|uniref:Uncharacterized protein n=1 Tax=Magnaporthiopsis poae (strain ATCC 64411 / 73-15) TaxID=644358 RepID=A0A0C4DQK4_MAGP6|nr:hypothetical protein MAPG_02148 [Magnaporthiopsis poae ATCC 64411]
MVSPPTMPSRTQSNGVTSKPGAKRFELPVLDFKFTPLTEGTDIPPPLPSPIEETPPPNETPTAAVDENRQQNGAASADGGHDIAMEDAASPLSTAKTGTKRPADQPISPVSPTSSKPGSIRRLFSRNLLNASYTEGEGGAGHNFNAGGTNSLDGRPESRSNFSVMTDGKRSKRSSSWFRRLRGGSDDAINRRATVLFEDIKQPVGPPPPMIPELSALDSKVDLNVDADFGADLFKNIK